MSSALLLGIDIGSTASKAVLLDASGAELGALAVPTGHDPRAAAEQLRAGLLAGRADAGAVRAVATGYGRAMVEGVLRTVTEITCHARGVRHLHPDARVILDIGGQDSKVIRLDANGLVQDFMMNDRCAAGTGAFLDVIAARFGRKVGDLSALHAANPEPLEVSSTCVVFAETEVVSLLSQGKRLDDVLAGVHRAIARRAAASVRQLGADGPVYFSGGVALNETLRREIELALGLPVLRSERPQFTGAYGAALLARD